jgi:transposase
MNGMKQRRYTTEFKSQAIELVKLGKSVTEVARDLALSEGVLYEWIRKASKAAPLGLRRLRRENANLKLENDILKKAAIILGTKPLPENMR